MGATEDTEDKLGCTGYSDVRLISRSQLKGRYWDDTILRKTCHGEKSRANLERSRVIRADMSMHTYAHA